MLLDVIFWIVAGCVVIAILWNLIVSILFMVEAYAEMGFGGALLAGLMMTVSSVWELAKYAIGVLVVLAVVRSCDDPIEKSGWSAQQRSEIGDMVTSWQIVEEVVMGMSSRDSVTEEIVSQSAVSLAEALELSSSVSDTVLTMIHPSMRFHFRKQYQAGLSAGLFGLRNSNTDSLDTGRLLLDAWGDWYSANYTVLEASLNR